MPLYYRPENFDGDPNELMEGVCRVCKGVVRCLRKETTLRPLFSDKTPSVECPKCRHPSKVEGVGMVSGTVVFVRPVPKPEEKPKSSLQP